LYQPKIDPAGNLIGLEALARWDSPTLGSVPPLRFIPLAEECGLIAAIGQWMLEQACQQMVNWQAQGVEAASVAVNASVRQFSQIDFVDCVARALKKTGLDPHRLEIEITESLLMSDPDETAAKLQQLRDMGVSIAIDDFGTGYSSLAYLSTLPIDSLKIDRSFVAGMTDKPQNLEIVRAVLTLGRSLGQTIIAEGIETAEQLAMLEELGVDVGQGYLLARPMRADQVPALLAPRVAVAA
jgi:EAL domain-containing protein (putative c-di-GMP-specific phosphodiesterase class I)